MPQKAHHRAPSSAEMGQIDRRRRRRGCAQTSAPFSLHRGLDTTFIIDGILASSVLFSTFQRGESANGGSLGILGLLGRFLLLLLSRTASRSRSKSRGRKGIE